MHHKASVARKLAQGVMGPGIYFFPSPAMQCDDLSLESALVMH